ncbi:hypothetical protein BV20DRAFT_1055094 [Pilatotrama ljubarskyi]|nr:hypothetical protein BV20DRAFT_1055094 [Pilatotrama ljubarskyi]
MDEDPRRQIVIVDASLFCFLGLIDISEPMSATDRDEPLDDYDPAVNGYCPATIGDVLRERYVVVRKLRWGVYSPVWLVRDLHAELGRQEAMAAAKVMTSIS